VAPICPCQRRLLIACPGGGQLPVKLQHLLKKIRDISAYLIQLMIQLIIL
jgi:hypothetical protein